MTAWCRRAAVALLAVFVASGPTAAAHRFYRLYDEDQGLRVAEVQSLAQDARGFIWIGTTGGLFRFDGRRIRAWAPAVLRTSVTILSASPGGAVLAGEAGASPPYLVRGDGLEELRGPEGRSLAGWRDGCFAGDGSLWIAMPSGLLRRDPNGAWSGIEADRLEGQAPLRLFPGPNGGVYVSTERALWRADIGGEPRKLFTTGYRVHSLAVSDEGSVVLIRFPRDRTPTVVYRWDGDRTSELLRVEARDLAYRGSTLWISGQGLWAVRPDGSVEVVNEGQPEAVGRPLLVDREGSLWLGSFGGVVQYPEPETAIYDHRDGLPFPMLARNLLRGHGALWVDAWSWKSGSLRQEGDRWVGRIEFGDREAGGRFCLDGREDLWASTIDGFARGHSGGGRISWSFYPASEPAIRDCALRPDGRLWLATREGLWLTTLGGGPPQRIDDRPPIPAEDAPAPDAVRAVLEDPAGTLWVAYWGEFICRASAGDLDAGRPTEWRCDRLPPRSNEIQDLHRLPSGSLWAATGADGVYRWTGEGWERISGSDDLLSQRVRHLVDSRSAGVWVIGPGNTIRVIERPDLPAGWEIVERLTTWHGLRNVAGTDLVEEEDGTLWICGHHGVARVPAAARNAPRHPPRVELVDILVDGRRQPLADTLRIPYRRNRVELHFAALSFRDPSLIRYQFRLSPDDPWEVTREPVIRFADLPPGAYHPEIRASLDGITWSEKPAVLALRVLRPWYLRAWAIAFYAIAAAAALYAAHRARVAVELRLERQRTRIAMDLHDEMGSGLSSIGVLADLSAEGALSDQERGDLSRKIARTALELGSSLSDIVWSLGSEAASIKGLAAYLAERGECQFPGDAVAFETDFPEHWPEVRLSLPVRRNVQLIAAEALHNAAKHAGARRVILGMRPEGRRWRLWVEDDGRGLEGSAPPGAGGGMGLESMHRRAAEIGASVRWSKGACGGTRVDLVFDPRAGAGTGARPR